MKEGEEEGGGGGGVVDESGIDFLPILAQRQH